MNFHILRAPEGKCEEQGSSPSTCFTHYIWMIHVLSRMLSISCVLQAGNIFAALSQGQSDDDEDLEKEDKPLRKVIKLHEGP